MRNPSFENIPGMFLPSKYLLEMGRYFVLFLSTVSVSISILVSISIMVSFYRLALLVDPEDGKYFVLL